MLVAFHQGLSDRSVYYRYFHLLSLSTRTTHERLEHVCHPDSGREFVFVAEHQNETTGIPEIIGVGRLVRLPDGDGKNAEFAIVVEDAFQHQGLGRRLLEGTLRGGALTLE